MLALDKNWYQFPETEMFPLRVDTSVYPDLDTALLGNFPHNVEVTVAERMFNDEDGRVTCGAFRLTTGLYVYFEINYTEEIRFVKPVTKGLHICGWPFEFEDIQWQHVEIPEPEPEERHPIFDLTDEI